MLSYEVQTGLLQLLIQVLPQGCKSMHCGLITCTTTSSVDEPCQFLWDCYTTQNELEFGGVNMDIMKHCSSSTGLHINTANQFKLNISRTT